MEAEVDTAAFPPKRVDRFGVGEGAVSSELSSFLGLGLMSGCWQVERVLIGERLNPRQR